ncbi:hypothetical protein T06_13816, partial [Trichinella sp. T6]
LWPDERTSGQFVPESQITVADLTLIECTAEFNQ